MIKPFQERIATLDISVFSGVPSQTTDADRRSLLAVQRAVAAAHRSYAYLEIGSHLGGTIQPHLADPRCSRIFSLDPRPAAQPDDRRPGYIAHYENNSSQRMLEMLANARLGDTGRISCIELDSSQVAPETIEPAPAIAFIDGEHTARAVLADFNFCCRVLRPDGVVVFHDFSILYRTLFAMMHSWRRQKLPWAVVRLPDNLLAVFFDPAVPAADPWLATMQRRTSCNLLLFRLTALAKSFKRKLLKALVK